MKHISLIFLLLFQLIADLNENFLQILKIQGGQAPPWITQGVIAPPFPPEYITHSLNKKRLDYRNNLRTKTIIETKLEKNLGTYFIDAKKKLGTK